MTKDVAYHAHLPAWQKFLIALVMVVITVIAVMVTISTTLSLEVLGLFVAISGVLLLSVGLVRTNDDLLFLATHHKKAEVQRVITHFATERFIVMLALFLLVLGMLLQLVGTVF